ncbi:hypothetical protein Pmani_001396 [Petrolisthes manimaculis]|uniref:Uncharacterized protein n=1 Tax=Petrolisthes manimaculis TaxID=1843537 RepID=A0AAE1US25_9EUCA|nr:hypothetical protein Pmani_001396 [Petrolisthes manimaculis]
MIANTFFTKKQEHRIIYKSGGLASQMDFLLYPSNDLPDVSNCKVIPGDHVEAQVTPGDHHVVTIDLSVKVKVSKGQKRKLEGQRKVKWFKLKDRKVSIQFKSEALQKIKSDIYDKNVWWSRTKKALLDTGREVLGESCGKIWESKETWWYSN